MPDLCEDGNEPPGFLKAISKSAFATCAYPNPRPFSPTKVSWDSRDYQSFSSVTRTWFVFLLLYRRPSEAAGSLDRPSWIVFIDDG
ncbi:hypothetical protein ANN_17155 [Periplaneta americana]|uniref:Uncharacterized protein n=1 Tax=Periplaneta americana TaxID=6978 RepID=A0ABQ8SS50_PERAM|nr:hypothetical protein ANN_17155 [Periplaneta americana]